MSRKAREKRVTESRIIETVHLITSTLSSTLDPAEGLRRTPGPKALLYYLPRDEQLQGERLPRSSRTIYGILKRAGRIAPRLGQPHEPVERPAPMSQPGGNPVCSAAQPVKRSRSS